MKKSEIFFALILIPIDAIMILSGFIIAYYWRKNTGDIIYLWGFDEYIKFIIMLLPLWIVIFAFEGLYKIKKSRQGIDELIGLIIAVSSGIMMVVAWLFLSRTLFFSRLIIIYSWLIIIAMVFLGRNIIYFIQKLSFLYNIGSRRTILVGDGKLTQDIIRYIQNNKFLGYYLVGIVSDNLEHSKSKIDYLGKIVDLEKIIKKNNPIDDLILNKPKLNDEAIFDIMQICEDYKISFKHIPNLYEVKSNNVELSTLAGIPIIEFKRTLLDGWGRIIKRLIDIIGALIGIIIFGPIMIIIGILIKFDSVGPIIYKNERVREGGKKFYTYKFRSMKVDYCTGAEYGGNQASEYEKKLIDEKNERIGPIYKVLKDPRRTRVGRFIEKLSLDELPQFFNVLLGNMSLVGPRPHQPREVEKYLPWHKKVLRIKPGITGMAQISGRSDLNFDDEAKLDIYYIENWSLWLDIKIIVKTPFAVIKPRKAV